jgi:alcohol dehydrogenase class IV
MVAAMRFRSSQCGARPVFNEGAHTQLPLRRVVWGAGTSAQLPSELDRLDARRALLVTTRSLERTVVRDVGAALGPALAGVATYVPAHVPLDAVNVIVEEAQRVGVDSLVTLGGGSAIDAGKAVIAKLAVDGRPGPAHIALPTTLSGAEFGDHFGVTEPPPAGEPQQRPRKRSHVDQSAVPRVVVLDPCLTVDTPEWLWFGSGIKAIDHAVEGMLGPGERPISDALAPVGICTLAAQLHASRGRDQLAARLNCQIAAWQCYAAPADIRFGPSHRIGHVLGGAFGVPHAFTSGITLPRVLAAVEHEHPNSLATVAAALSGPDDAAPGVAGEAGSRLDSLVSSLGLPRRLSEVGIRREQLPDIASLVAATSRETVDVLGVGGLRRVLDDAF